MKIAVVGSGISGLVAARELSVEHEVHVFESQDRIGGHTNTIDVEIQGRSFSVDTGFIVFNESNYPLFSQLLRDLDVASRPTEMSFSVRNEQTGVEYNGTSLDKLFVQRRNAFRPSFLRMIADILRFNRTAPRVLEDAASDGQTVLDWVEHNGFSRAFVEDHLLPLGSALWSCPQGTFARFPIRFLVAFLSNHGMLSVSGRPTWRTVTGGSGAYLAPLTRTYHDRIHLSTPVASIRRDPIGVALTTAHGDVARFDHVVLACHSDQAMRMLEDPSPAEREVLGAIRYQSNDVILHTDVSVLPRNRRAWASWNYRLVDGADRAATITYDMNILQGLDAPVEFCVSLNQTDAIDPARVIRRLRYEHPVFDVAAERARARRSELLVADRTSYCGAYWGWGFHEDGVRSAHDVCRAMARRPVS